VEAVDLNLDRAQIVSILPPAIEDVIGARKGATLSLLSGSQAAYIICAHAKPEACRH